MMDEETDGLLNDAHKRMEQACEVLTRSLSAMRTGRASPELVENIEVDCYGSSMPLKQIAAITVEEGRTLVVQPWDKGLIGEVEKAIRTSPLEFNPVATGEVLRVPMPPLSEEMRQRLAKQARADAEKSRISVRNVRRDCIQRLKNLSGGQDQQRDLESRIQRMTDEQIAGIDAVLKEKEATLLQI